MVFSGIPSNFGFLSVRRKYSNSNYTKSTSDLQDEGEKRSSHGSSRLLGRQSRCTSYLIFFYNFLLASSGSSVVQQASKISLKS